MKRSLVFLFLAWVLFSAQAQDTVRYGDPWYAFNPMPVLRAQGYGHPSVSPSNPFAPMEFLSEMQYQAYRNDNYVVYGIAFTADTVPGQHLYGHLKLMRGLHFHKTPKWETTVSPEPFWDSNFIFIDSLGEEDTLFTWIAPRRRCVFEYNLGYDATTQTYTEKDSGTVEANCFEFYFDHPIPLGKNSKGGVDTFYVGAKGDMDYDPNGPFEYTYFLNSHTYYCGIDLSYCQPWIYMTLDPAYGGINGESDGNAYFNNLSFQCSPLQFFSGCTGATRWGALFPIVKLRCVTPELTFRQRNDSSAIVSWRQYDLTPPTGYELAVGPVGGDPDAVMPLQLGGGTVHTITGLEPDSTYWVWIRKSCRYRTVGYDTVVWSDWSQPETIVQYSSQSGIGVVDGESLRVYSRVGEIVVESDELLPEVRVYDMQGRQLAFAPAAEAHRQTLKVPASGVYVVRLDGWAARRVVTVK